MKAIRIPDAGTAPATVDAQSPTVQPDQVLVRVAASSINATDGGTASGMFAGFGMPHDYPVTLGRDFAGTVEQLGDGVEGLAVGDAVFGEVPFVPPLAAGAWAEQIVVDAASVVLRPASVDVATAGAAPLVVVTALMVADAIALTAGEAVLVVGATGGVGSVVTQLAAAAGAVVIAPARDEDQEFLRDLGVTEFVPRDGDTAAAVRAIHPDGVDAIVDLVTFGAIGAYDAALADGGRVASATNAAGSGPGRTDVDHYPTQQLLQRTADLLADGTIRVPISRSVKLGETAAALQSFGSTSHRGKVAVRIA